ncbi:MAG: ribosome assembly RNA-binding protein YhbY [Halothiobacillus sp.]
MALTTKQKQFLRAQAHHLSPVVLLGQHGLTEAVMAEIELALGIHELIKVRIPGQDREDKKAMMQQIATTTQAELVQTVGHMAVFYRPDPDGARLILPKPERAGSRKPL